MTTRVVSAFAALAETTGCFAFRAWSRLDRSAWWLVPGLAVPAMFALLPTFAGTAFAGGAYAAYGGIYVARSLVWPRVVEGTVPDRWDLLGGFIVLAGAVSILFSPRLA